MTLASTTLIDHLGQPAVQLALPNGSRAIVLLHGAHVVSWQNGEAGEQLYLSPTAVAGPGKAVRGGVPVIFPQFEQRGPDHSLPRHGLARTRTWRLDDHRVAGDAAMATLVLTDNEETRALWPHAFALELTVSLSPHRLDMELHVEHTGAADTQPWSFSAALHTYLAVSELNEVRLRGLDGCLFLDSITQAEYTEDHYEKRFVGEIDRIYTKVPATLQLRDSQRRLSLQSSTFEDAVLWNPGADKCEALADMPNDDWRRMLCVEAAQIMSPPQLAPGESWTARQSLVVEG